MPESKVVIIIPAYQPQYNLLSLLKNIYDKNLHKIVVVDDGSTKSESLAVFKEIQDHTHIDFIRNAVNLGKGEALKKAFNHTLLQYPDCIGVVTADADGQHLPEDIKNIATSLTTNPHSLILGKRSFTGKVPLRSDFGNRLTRLIFHFFTGKKIYDTQTGLRGIPLSFLKDLLKVRASGYEFELEMLIKATKKPLDIKEIEIRTIYENNNSSSHFNPLLDSLKIYFVFLRFSALSLVTALLDNIVFAIAYSIFPQILSSTLIARIVAASFNYYYAKKMVFHSKGNMGSEIIKFSILVICLMFASYGLIKLIVDSTSLNVYVAKIIAEGALFLASFSLQNVFVFNRRKKK